MELEKAIEKCNKIITTKFINDYSIDSEDKKAIEIILRELEYKDEQIDKLYNENIELENYKSEYEKGNLIPKKKIENKIKELKQNQELEKEGVFNRENVECIEENVKIKILQELLEDK